jgi:hypothetical protein
MHPSFGKNPNNGASKDAPYQGFDLLFLSAYISMNKIGTRDA